MKRLVRYFLQGLLYLAPTAVTIYIVYLVFRFADGPIRQYVVDIFKIDIPGIGILVILAGITLLGFIGQTILFRPIRLLIDKIMKKISLLELIFFFILKILLLFIIFHQYLKPIGLFYNQFDILCLYKL